jgi:hypothetical protein
MSKITKPFKVFFHKLFSKKSRPAYYRNPVSDWRNLLIYFAFLSCAVIVLNVYLYMQINSGDFFGKINIQQKKSDALNTKLLDDTNTFYDSRATTFHSISASTTVPIDPSI